MTDPRYGDVISHQKGGQAYENSTFCHDCGILDGSVYVSAKKTVIINSCRHTDESGSGALAVTVPIL